MIDKIGFFHFAEYYERPIESLVAALSADGDVSGSMIVLPEAFNNGKFYYDNPRMAPEFSAADTVRILIDIARQFGVAFVAGLLNPPHSLSVAVWRSGDKVLSYKKTDDQSGNYTPWVGAHPNNPIMIDDMCAGVLLCNEVDYPDEVIARLDNHANVRKVICVPACMSSAYFSGDNLACSYWLGKYLVLANSRADGCGSFITNTMRRKVVKLDHQTQLGDRCNRVILKPWAELDGT